MRTRVAVIGAGIGGLAAAVRLAARGLDVTVLEQAAHPGGKLRVVTAGGARIDAGPTVFTMRWVFEELFAEAGAVLSDVLTLTPAGTLARHAWADGARLDLFADRMRSADAIGRFAGAGEARGYLAFAERAARIWRTLENSFIRAERGGVLDLVARTNPRALLGISPFTTLDRALARHFRDPRLRQLFGRYATYCGSSPYRSPATLMLVAHVESQGVWLVDGGMHRVAEALARLAERLGATIRYGAAVARVTVAGGRADGVVLADGQHLPADAVICNADCNAVASGLFGASAAVAPLSPAARSLSALTWAMKGRPAGFPLLHHTVFFSDDYKAEFDALAQNRLPAAPTIYLCAQDRTDIGAGGPDRVSANGTNLDGIVSSGAGPDGDERLFCLVNAPPMADTHPLTEGEIAQCEERSFAHLRRCGLTLAPMPRQTIRTGPAEFARMFPATGGALYGPASHGWAASFRRPGARTRLPNLYLAGGSTHPGPGVPMAALSGGLAASALIADLASTVRCRQTVTSGGTSTP